MMVTVSLHVLVFLSLTCIGASRSVEAVYRPIRSGRKDYILHDVGTEQPSRGRRTTVSAVGAGNDEVQHDGKSLGNDRDTSYLHLMNAFTSDMNVSVRLKDAAFDGLSYGDIRSTNLKRPLELTETYYVSVGNDSYTANVSSSVTRIPAKADVFLITDVSYEGRLRDTLSVWDRTTPMSDGCFWLLSYNAFSHSGLDVLVFDPSKVGTDHYSLHRIGMSIESFDAYYVELEESTYEVKVVAHNMVQNIDDFKNTPSLTPPLYIHPKAGERYYAAITGIYQQTGKFQPQYKSVPQLPKTAPLPYEMTKMVVFNAYPSNAAVEIYFPGNHRFKHLPYGHVTEAQFSLKRYDMYRIRSKAKSHWLEYHVDIAVPYIKSECLLVTDMGSSRALENILLCRSSDDLQMPIDNGRILTYHALNNYSQPIDVLLFDHSMLNNPSQHSLYSIADKLVLGDGVRASLPSGKYKVKVVPSGTITDSNEFEAARSLIPVFSLDLESGGYYYLIINGIFGNKQFPASHIMHTEIKKPTTDYFSFSTPQATDVPSSRRSSPDLVDENSTESQLNLTGNSSSRAATQSSLLGLLLTVAIGFLLW